MFYAGYLDDKVVERLPFILKRAKFKPREIKADFSDPVIERENFHNQLQNNIIIVYPINQYFQKKAFRQAFNLINKGFTVLFIDFESENESFISFHKREIHSHSFHSIKDRKIFRLFLYNQKIPTNMWYETLVEITNKELAYKYSKLLKKEKFKETVDRLFDSIDATVTGKHQYYQKLIYLLLFKKNPDPAMLKEQFGDDKKFKAETIASQWKLVLDVNLNSTELYQEFEYETFGDMDYFEDIAYKEGEA